MNIPRDKTFPGYMYQRFDPVTLIREINLFKENKLTLHDFFLAENVEDLTFHMCIPRDMTFRLILSLLACTFDILNKIDIGQ